MPPQPNIALETIRRLANGRVLLTLQAGEIIFSAGEPGDCLYALIDGQVMIEWGRGIYEILDPGTCFGFDVMVDPLRLRYCRAIAKTDTKLLPMNREQFLLAIHEFPMFALESLQVLDERLRRVKASDDAVGAIDL
ncbi:MAG: Crp/Fnr family transcriptional regulator [Cyanobacteriota bacterium]|nr:Crp/Fnr family transcriptional regulator [Cyanobacteriota bacterium]